MSKRAAEGDGGSPAKKGKGGFKLPDCPFSKVEFLAKAVDIPLEFELQPKAFGPGGYGWQKGGGIKKVEADGPDSEALGDKICYVRPSCIANVQSSKGGDQGGLSTKDFLGKAATIAVKFDCWPCEFSTGSFGWMAHMKRTEKVGSKELKLQINMNAPIDKSREAGEKEPEDPALADIDPKAIKDHMGTIGIATAKDKQDLTKIRGIGPWIQKRLNRIGIFTFKQLASMTLEIEQAVNVAIKYFPGRVHRDEWAFQAQKIVGGKWEELNPLFSRSGKSPKVEIDGEEYERELVDIANYAMKDGHIEFYEAEALWWSATDGNKVTPLEMKTLKYIMSSPKYKLDEEALSFLQHKMDD